MTIENKNKSPITIGEINRKILRFSLIWPSEENEMNPGKWYYIRVLLFISITIPWGLSVLMHADND